MAQQLLLHTGTGRKNDAYRYWRRSQEAKWDEEFPLWRAFMVSQGLPHERGPWMDMPGARE